MIRDVQSEPIDDGAGIEAALKRAALRARETARRHGTKLVIWRDGQVCEVDPDDVSLPGDGSLGGSARGELPSK